MKKIGRGFKQYFIPHTENDHKPQILRFRTVALVCLVMVLAEAAFIIGPSYLINRSKLFGIIITNALVDETNQNRLANKLPALHINALLQAAAQEKANDMAANSYFAHTSPAGLSPWYWFMKVGYNFTAAGENLAINFSDSQDVTTAWMNSPEHRANILNGTYTEIGMATAQGTYQGRQTIYVVELFGTPIPANAEAVAVAAKPAPIATRPKTVAIVKPKAPTPAAPVIVTTTAIEQNSAAATAVKGAETQNIAPSPTQAPTPAPTIPQNNRIQNAVAAPHSLMNDLYIFIIGLFALALALNIFIKIRIQYPTLIFGGVMVIALAAIFIALNQYGALANLKIG